MEFCTMIIRRITQGVYIVELGLYVLIRVQGKAWLARFLNVHRICTPLLATERTIPLCSGARFGAVPGQSKEPALTPEMV